MAEVLIREASDEDGAALLKLLGETWADYGHDGLVFASRSDGLAEGPASYFSHRDGRLWLVVSDGEVSGSLAIARLPGPDEFELSLVCLDAASRGQGFAAALLAGANAFAAASGGSKISARVDTRLVDGVRFLERHGFVREPGIRQSADGAGALEEAFSKAVDSAGISSRPSEARQADVG